MPPYAPANREKQEVKKKNSRVKDRARKSFSQNEKNRDKNVFAP
jgi:hypothetical protein